jgi:CHAD domain-containing protein
MLPGNEPQRLKDELRWLTGIIGEASNIDVLLSKAKDKDLHERLEKAREAAFDDALTSLASSRARTLMVDLNQWLRCGECQRDPRTAELREGPALDFAGAALDRLRKRLRKHGMALSEVDDEHRHEARKDAKKLRYAAEFFASFFDDKRGVRRHMRFVAAMEELQNQLGALNDLATGPDVLEKHNLADHAALDDVVSQVDKAGLIDAAQTALYDVIDAKRFWR